MTLRIAAILPTHDRPDSLRRCVESVLAQDRRPDELVLVNDGSVPIAAELLETLHAASLATRVIHRDVPSSTASRNAGLTAADGDVLLLLEDDIVLPPDFIRRLAALYAADTDGCIGGIGPVIDEPDTRSLSGRAWLAAERLLGRGRWGPRHVASRYYKLPPSLAGRLQPVRKLSAGGLSLRADVAEAYRFDEMLSGYAWSEDRELTFRIGQVWPLYRAPELVILHHREAGGRGDWRGRGRGYAANTLHVAQQLDGGVGTQMLVAWDLAGTLVQYCGWSLLSRTRRPKLAFARGVVEELSDRGRRAVRRCLCG
jgi:glycosyltransferase involved in cell wall biosynthesis